MLDITEFETISNLKSQIISISNYLKSQIISALKFQISNFKSHFSNLARLLRLRSSRPIHGINTIFP